MREQTKDEFKFWGIVVAIVVIFATTVYLLTILTSETKAGDYLQTPSQRTQVYKFVEDDGTKCYIAESDGGAVALQCEIAP